MIKLFLFLKILLGVCLAMESDHFFPEKGFYLVYGKMEKKEKERVKFVLFHETTSQGDFDLKDETDQKIFDGNFSVLGCLKIKKPCSWNCEGSLEKVKIGIHPMNIPKDMKAISRVKSCSKVNIKETSAQ